MKEGKKILFVGHYAGRTGAPMVLLYLLQWLKKNTTLSFETVLRDGGPLESEYARLAPVQNLSQHHSSARSGLLARIQNRLVSPAPANPLESFCEGKKWDLIYSNTITNGSVVAQLAASGCPVITHVHEMEYWIERSGTENFELVKQHTTHFIAVSRSVKENLVEKYLIPEEKISVVHEFLPFVEQPRQADFINRLRKELGIPDTAFILGGSGAEYWRKGRDLVVHLLMALKRREPKLDVHFIWVGHEGSLAEKTELGHDLRHAALADRFHAIGEVSNPLDYFALADAFVLLSREDPFPLVCLEAAAIGKPILCFAGAGGIPELVEGDSGFVVPYLDIEAMADKVLFLWQNRSECFRLGQCGTAKVKDSFSVEVQAPKILKIIQNTVKK